MANIRMSYIIIEKEKHDENTLQQLVTSCLDRAVVRRDNECLYMSNNEAISYSIVQRRNSNRCYLSISSKLRMNIGINYLQQIDDSICNSEFRKNMEVIRDYDGISEALCEKLYPKFSTFERGMRQIILLVLTKAFGVAWRNETIPDEMLNNLKKNAKGKLSLTDTLEQMDLATLEQYLFEKREIDYRYFVEETLSKTNIEKMSREDICKAIEDIRAKSLWKRNFEFIGSEEDWSKRIKEIHDYRNRVAHCKHITEEEYVCTNRKLNVLNKKIDAAISEIQNKDFTDISAIDVLGNFAILASKLVDNAFTNYNFSKMFEEINTALQRMVRPIAQAYTSTVAESLQKAVLNFTNTPAIFEEQKHIAENYSEMGRRLSKAIQSVYVPQMSAAELNAISVAKRVNDMVPTHALEVSRIANNLPNSTPKE